MTVNELKKDLEQIHTALALVSTFTHLGMFSTLDHMLDYVRNDASALNVMVEMVNSGVVENVMEAVIKLFASRPPAQALAELRSVAIA